MAKFTPLGDRVLVRRVDSESKVGSIFLPDTAREKPQEGIVIAVGRGKTLEDGTVKALDVKTGDRVLFGKFAGTEIQLNNEPHQIMREDEILGVIEIGQSAQS